MRADVIVIDDIGLLPVTTDTAEGLYRVVDAAYEKRSIRPMPRPRQVTGRQIECKARSQRGAESDPQPVEDATNTMSAKSHETLLHRNLQNPRADASGVAARRDATSADRPRLVAAVL